ncbi:MAG: hypothetical protein DSZ24_03785 [Thermodesulfatator sp.]|nr:MAG: hypothetical protein DSZ24_03785 [Thermodesulfatator sp.]
MAVTLEELKAELSPRIYRVLTDGEDAVAERALVKARAWVVAQYKRCGREPDLEDEIVREAVLKRALYELYSYAENEKVARDKKEDARELLEGVLGDCVEGEEGEGVRTTAAARVKPGKLSPLAQEMGR